MAGYTREELAAALKQAHAAGDTKSAQAIAAHLNASKYATDAEFEEGLTGGVTDTGPDDNRAATAGGVFMSGVGDAVETGGDILGIVGNPLNATINVATGSNLSTDLGQTARDGFGLPQGNETISAINQGAMGGLGFAGGARLVAGALKPGALQNTARIIGEMPGIDALAGGASGLGGEWARQSGFGPVGQTLSALAFGGPVAALGARQAGRAKVASPMAEAAERQGVSYLPADAGGQLSKIITNAAKVSPVSSGPIVKQARANVDSLDAATNRAARNEAQQATTDRSGEIVQDAAKEYSKRTSNIGDNLYKRAWRDPVASVLVIPPRTSIAKIDSLLADLRSAPNTNTTAINTLVKLRTDLQSGMTAKNLHSLRSEIRDGIYDGGLRSGADKARMKSIGRAMNDDLLGYLDATGNRRTADTIRRADGFWKKRVEQIDKVLQPIVGKDGMKGGEQVVQSIETMTRGGFGGNKRLAKMMREMAPDDQSSVRATLIDRLGRAKPGQQTADGEAFSPDTFLTNWSGMTPQAKATLFGDGDLRRNLDDIALLAEKMKATQRMANHSNTGGSLLGNIALQTAWAAGHFPTYIVGLGGQFVTGRMMANPGFAKWLAKAPATSNPKAMKAYINRLGVLGARETLIANDARALQQHLQQSLGQSPVRAAAGEEEEDAGRVPPQ